MKSDDQIVKEAEARKKLSNSKLGKQRRHTRECEAFYAGDLMDYKDSMELSDAKGKSKRVMVQFQRVKPYVNAVKGFMAQNRRKAKYGARIDSQEVQEMYSGYANAVADYVRDNADADQVESQQDEDMLVGGIGAIETCMTYGDGYVGNDPNGEILFEPLDMDMVFYDPNAKRKNLIDSRFCGYEKVYDLDEALEQFDKSAPEDFEDAEQDERNPVKIDSRSGQNYRVIDGYDWKSEEDRTIKVTFYQWYEVEKVWRFENPLKAQLDPMLKMRVEFILNNIEVGDFDGYSPEEDVIICDSKIKAQIVEAIGDAVEFFPAKRKAFYYAVYSGKKVFDKYRSVTQQGFTIQFKTGDRDKKNKIWTGMVSAMMEPTLYYNKALTELMYIIAVNAKGGVMYEEGSVDDIVAFERSYARTNTATKVNNGALSGGRIQPKRTPHQPTGYEEVINISSQAIQESSGIPDAFLGEMQGGNETGLLQRRRIRQVISTLASYFDSITLYQKRNGRILLDFMRVLAENNPGMIIRLIGRDGKEEFAPLISDPLMAEFEVTVTEAPQTPEEKQEYATMLGNMGNTLIAGGDIQTGKKIFAISIKYLPLEATDKAELSELLSPDQGQVDPAYVKQLEQQIQALTGEAQKVQLENVLADTGFKKAKQAETLAGIRTKQIDSQSGQQLKAAQTAKTLEEAEKVNTETEAAKKAPVGEVNVNL